MIKPNFIIIGAAKAGTTALHHYLNQHPQIYMSPVKETKFFVFENRAVDYRGPGDLEANRWVITNLTDYAEQFAGVTDELAIGESSPLYLYDPLTPQSIYHHIPHVKLIAILRNPVDRAYSSFLHLVQEGRETVLDFSKALQQEDSRIANNWALLWHYQKAGLYFEQLKRYFAQFNSQQIRVYLYEDLSNHPISLLKNIFSFLEVDATFIPDVKQRHNVSLVPKNRTLHAWITGQGRLKRMLERSLPEGWSTPLLQSVKQKNLGKPRLSPELRKQLIQNFQNDIIQLQDLIDRDLSHWLVDP